MLRISVPKPCHEDWNVMNPREQGRFCNSCEKTVIDFTDMDDEAVKNFFITRMHDRVCGRFTSQQLHRIRIDLPSNIFSIQMATWKKFLAACLIAFSTTLLSCEVSTNGTPIPLNGNEKANVARIDTIPENQRTLGIVSMDYLQDSVKKCGDNKPITQDTTIASHLMGDIQIVPDVVKPEHQDILMGKPAVDFIQPENKDSVKNQKGKTECESGSYQ